MLREVLLRIDIAVAIDKNYLQHFYVLLESINEYKSTFDFYMINVLHTNLEVSDIVKLQKLYSGVFNFSFYEINDFHDLYVNAHISIETYYRIIIPNILPFEIHKVLYLDCDLLINHNLAQLWDNDIESFAVGAVFDYKAQNRKVELNIPF